MVQIQNYCSYNDLPAEMKPAYFAVVEENYFTVIS